MSRPHPTKKLTIRLQGRKGPGASIVLREDSYGVTMLVHKQVTPTQQQTDVRLFKTCTIHSVRQEDKPNVGSGKVS